MRCTCFRSLPLPLAIVFLGLAACGGGTDDTGPVRRWSRPLNAEGKFSGVVVDVETGEPVAGAEVQIGGRRVPTGVDGSFETTAAPGRARVAVQSEGYVPGGREVMVGESRFSLPFRIARRAPRFPIGRAGGVVTAGRALVEVPPNTRNDGASVSVTYLPRTSVGAMRTPVQVVDPEGAPRRAVGMMAIDSSEPPAGPSRMMVPVPDDATTETVIAARLDAEGNWASMEKPMSIVGGMATFPVAQDGDYVVMVDARSADGRRVGYMVVESGDAPAQDGEVLVAGAEIGNGQRPMAMVDPTGTRMDFAPGSRTLLEAPAEGQPGGSSAPYVGRMQVPEGAAQAVVSRPMAVDPAATRLSVAANVTSFEATGTAFGLVTCQVGSRRIDILEVVEGAVTPKGEPKIIAGTIVTFCKGCPKGATPPTCPAPVIRDGGPRPDAAAGDRPADMVRPMVDASTEVRPPDVVRDMATPVDMPPPAPDVPLPPDAAPPPPDMATPPPDAGVSPDAPLPPPDMAPDLEPDLAPDMPAPQPDMAAPQPDMAVPPPDAGSPALSVTPSPHNFGFAAPATGTAAVVFRVTNTGSAPTGAVTAALGGPDTTQFTLDSNGCMAPLAPAAWCDVGVRFTPSSIGAKSATLQASETGGASGSAALSGTGAFPAALSIAPTSGSYGSVVEGSTSAAQTFTVTNGGGMSSGPVSMAVTGDTSQFPIVAGSDTCSGNALPQAGTCTIQVFFAPASAGAKSASLVASATPGGMATASLSGTGLRQATLSIAPTSYDWLGIVMGTSGATQQFTVTNVGDVDSGTPSYAVTPADFVVRGSTCTAPLVPMGFCYVDLIFTPQVQAPRMGSLTVSATPGGAATASLAGTGVSVLTITPPSYNYPATPMGQSSSNRFSVANTHATLTTGTPSVTTTGDFVITANGCSAPIPPAPGNCFITVSFVPKSVGTLNGSLVVSTLPGGSATAALSGMGTP